VVGIDEVGRGPIAGPVAVGVVKLNTRDKKSKIKVYKMLEGIRDSKKLSAKQRWVWFEKLTKVQQSRVIGFHVSFVGASVVDRLGITRATRIATARALQKLIVPYTSKVLLDAGLVAPARYKDQEAIIRGDEREPLIAAASVVAKVLRDGRMNNYAKRFPQYGFERHVGYGTDSHYRAIKRHGLCPLHRRSFIY